MKQVRDIRKSVMRRLSSDGPGSSSTQPTASAEPSSASTTTVNTNTRSVSEPTPQSPPATEDAASRRGSRTSLSINDLIMLRQESIHKRKSSTHWSTTDSDGGEVAVLEDGDAGSVEMGDDNNVDEENGVLSSILDYPEVGMLVHQLEERIDTLESMMAECNGETLTASANGDDSNKTVAISFEQMDALKGLSSNVSGLLHCLNHHHCRKHKRLTDTKTDVNSNTTDPPIRMKRQSFTYGSIKKPINSAKSPSSRRWVREVLDREPPPSSPQNQKHARHTTVFASNKGMNFSLLSSRNESIYKSTVPKELIYNMMDSESSDGMSSAAYLAQTYGGIELPSQFRGEAKKMGRRKPFKDFAKSMTTANEFVKQLYMTKNVRRDLSEYLPREFTVLGLSERKRLACLLSWEGLKVWGFDAFEVEKLSTAPLVKRASIDSPPEIILGKDKKVRPRISQEVDALTFLSGSKDSKEGDNNEEDIDISNNVPEDVRRDELTITHRGCPMVLIGWALLASPYAQLAMAENVENEELIGKAKDAIMKKAERGGKYAKELSKAFAQAKEAGKGEAGKTEASRNIGSISDSIGWMGGYFLPDEFDITPRALCSFFRMVEKDYPRRKVNPYHNNVHGADVIQSTHALIQMGEVNMALAYTPFEIYTILLAAALHDVRHPGTNNNYQINKQTELSLIYNDNSVLENMHASRASYLLKVGEEIGARNGDDSGGIMGNMDGDQRKLVRTQIIRSILYTDMSRHFAEVAKMKRYVDAVKDEMNGSELSAPFLTRIGQDKHAKLRDKMLPYILHLADISNPSKNPRVSIEWSNCAYDEFFLQGDKEAEEGMAISPLCDRTTTNIADGQVGFINFVVKPAFEILTQCIPNVECVVNQVSRTTVVRSR